MGCVEPMAAAVEDERRTRLLGVGWVNWHNRIGKRFFPVPKIVAGGNAGGPLTTRFECTGMVVSVVAAFVANDLIDGNRVSIVALWPAGEDWLVARIGKHLEIF